MKCLSQDLRAWRADRPDEWIMDRFILSAEKLEAFHTAKHNRDVELTDLLTHLLDRYGDWMTPMDRERIEELTKPAE